MIPEDVIIMHDYPNKILPKQPIFVKPILKRMVKRKYLRVADVAEQAMVSPSSIRRYTESGELKEHRTPGGQRAFLQEEVDQWLGKTLPETAAFYCRSSSGSKTSLANQESLLSAITTAEKVYKERGSGLSENRPQLERLIKDAEAGLFNTLYVTEPDRLSRFGRTWIEKLLKTHGVTVKYASEPDKKDLQSELLEDFMSLLAIFSGRFYRLRGKEQKLAMLELAKTEIEK